MTAYSQTAIGGLNPDPSAMLYVQSEAKGVLFPGRTSMEQNLFQNPASGLIIFNTETMCLETNPGEAAAPFRQAMKCRGIISALICNGAMFIGILIEESPAPGITFSVSPNRENGEVHLCQTVTYA